MGKRQQSFERRAIWNSAAANVLFVFVVLVVVNATTRDVTSDEGRRVGVTRAPVALAYEAAIGFSGEVGEARFDALRYVVFVACATTLSIE